MAYFPAVGGNNDSKQVVVSFGNHNLMSYSVSCKQYNGWENFNIYNFSIQVTNASAWTDNNTSGGSATISTSYNKSTGVFTCTGTNNTGHVYMGVSGNVSLVYYE